MYYYYYTKNYRYGKKKRKPFSSLCPHQSYPHYLLPYILNCIGSSKWCLVYCSKRVRLTNTLSCKGNGVRSTDTSLQYCHQAAPATPSPTTNPPHTTTNTKIHRAVTLIYYLPTTVRISSGEKMEKEIPKSPRNNMKILRASKKKKEKEEFQEAS